MSIVLLLLGGQRIWMRNQLWIKTSRKHHTMEIKYGCQTLLEIAQKMNYFFFW